MSENRHRAPRAKRASAEAPAVSATGSQGRHRAAAKPSRTPVAAGAAATAAAVAVAGFVVLDAEGSESPALASAGSALANLPSFHSASLDASLDAALVDRSDGDRRAARDRARGLLAERIEAVEKAAAEAARKKLQARQRACGYNPSIQRGLTTNAAQRRNARTIIDVAERMKLPRRAAVIAIATALQESFLHNVSGGDRDSRGLFQQRPSMGWGSYTQVGTPDYAARKFYSVLQDLDGWQRLPVTVAAQRVQISAFPLAYARWEKAAATLVAKETGASAESLTCRPR
ncbi:MAG: hypothetical protein ACT4QG_00460 [Sporichthyaceae bacterium]